MRLRRHLTKCETALQISSGNYGFRVAIQFRSGQYSSGLPCGGMVGYVMDNEVKKAFDKVRDSIADKLRELRVPSRNSIPIWTVFERPALRRNGWLRDG